MFSTFFSISSLVFDRPDRCQTGRARGRLRRERSALCSPSQPAEFSYCIPCRANLWATSPADRKCSACCSTSPRMQFFSTCRTERMTIGRALGCLRAVRLRVSHQGTHAHAADPAGSHDYLWKLGGIRKHAILYGLLLAAGAVGGVLVLRVLRARTPQDLVSPGFRRHLTSTRNAACCGHTSACSSCPTVRTSIPTSRFRTD
jgi:hypothetical protein